MVVVELVGEVLHIRMCDSEVSDIKLHVCFPREFLVKQMVVFRSFSKMLERILLMYSAMELSRRVIVYLYKNEPTNILTIILKLLEKSRRSFSSKIRFSVLE